MALNKLNHNYTDPLSVSSLTVSGNLVVGGALNVPLSVTAGSFVKSGGTSNQFLKADGSVDSSAVAKTDTANTFTKNQTITPGTSVTGLTINAAASSVGLIVKANATTPGDIQEWQSDTGAILTKITSAGNILISKYQAGGGNITIDNNGYTGVTTQLLNEYGGSALNSTGVAGVSGSWLRFSVQGTEFMRIDSSSLTGLGNVGYIYIGSNIGTYPTTANSTNSSNLTIKSGNVSGLTSNSGNVVIDAGTATGTTGTISIGATNASSVTIGKSNNTVTVSGNLTALSITKTGGTSSQFLKADGSVDSTAYQASNTTLTGVAGLSSSGTGLVKNTAGTWSYDTNTYITGSSPTITTPIIDVINAASATGTTQSLFPNTTTGTMAIGAGLTTGTVNIATGGSSTNAINMGNTNTTVTINGNLDVKGITTTIESTTVTVKDKNIELASVVGSPTDTTADGGGITVKGGTDKTFNYVNATPAFTSSENMDLASGKAYKIAGTTVLSGTGLGTGVTGSSLTSVGTIGTGTWQGSVIGGTYGGTGVNNGSSTITLAGNFVTSGANSLTLTTTGTTSLTLPTSGTVSTEDAAFYYAMIL